MKQNSGGITRLMEFTGNYRGLLTVSRILSGISSVFILAPFLCVYFAARDLVGIFAGTPLDTNSLVCWGLIALGLELIGLVLYFSALLCSHVVAFHTEKNLKMAALLLPCGGVPHREKPENGGAETSGEDADGVL